MKKYLVALMSAAMLGGIPESSAQTVQAGWRVAGQIKAQADLIGAWEVIGGFDLDNDGNGEFIFTIDPTISGGTTLDTDPWTVFYYEASGDDTYEERWSFRPTQFNNNAARSYPSIAVGDVDLDGFPELYFNTPADVETNPPRVRGLLVFEFDGTNFPTAPSESWNIGVPDNFTFISSGIALGDVDGDGEVEIVLQSRTDDYTGGRTMVVANNAGIDIGLGLGAFQVEFREESNVLAGGAVYDPRIIDFDGDGKQEIWVFTWDFLSLAIYEATGPDTYVLQADINEVVDPLDYGHRRGMRFYDANGDGKLEFYSSTLSGDGNPGSAIFYIGSTDDVSTLSGTNVIRLGGTNPHPGHGGSAVGDIDADGNMDFLYVSTNPATGKHSQIIRMEYKGTGDLADSTSYEWTLFFENTNTESDLRNLAIDDFDGDGKYEVIVTNLDVASTDEAILYILESETATSVQQDGVLAETFALHQNYPNPFNPGTSIQYNLPRAGEASIKVFDLRGVEVRTLTGGFQAAGAHSVAWDGRDNFGNPAAAGIYVYTVTSNGVTQSRKMTLVK